ncbi:cysteine peptidase family C39 domain-containing protein [Mycoplasmopsis cynos]|nr:cysteine peptidase family C39 domain-containing protein [Mycoplasmopsis cynos]
MNKNEFKQIDQKDCSLYVFKYFLHYKEGINISIDELKLQTKYQVNGISLEDFNQSIMNQNWEIAVYNTDFDTLTKINDSEFPFAVIVNTFDENHMVLLTEFNAENIVYYDPNIGSEVCLKLNEFKKIFKEVLIEFKKRKTNIQSIKSSKDSINPKLTTNLSLWELHKKPFIFIFYFIIRIIIFDSDTNNKQENYKCYYNLQTRKWTYLNRNFNNCCYYFSIFISEYCQQNYKKDLLKKITSKHSFNIN